MNLVTALINRAVVGAKNGARKLRTLQIELLDGDVRQPLSILSPMDLHLSRCRTLKPWRCPWAGIATIRLRWWSLIDDIDLST